MTVPTRNIVIRYNVFCNVVTAVILHHAGKMMEEIVIYLSAGLFS